MSAKSETNPRRLGDTAADLGASLADNSDLQPAERQSDRGRKALVILNPVAGQSSPDEIRQLLDEQLTTAGWEYQIHETSPDDDLGKIVGEACRESCELVIACGGDGTVALVAEHLVGGEIPLGILPSGTGNVLSRELGIPLDLPGAIAVVVGDHRVGEIDAMRIGNRHYFLNVAIGLPAEVMKDTPRSAKQRFGMLAYMRTAIDKLLNNRPTRFRLVVDGKARTVRAGFITVANAGALGNASIRWSQDSLIDDGIVDVVVARTRNFRDYLSLAWYLWTGRTIGQNPVQSYGASREVTVTAARPLPVQADGEVIGSRTFKLQVVPRAVRIVLPIESADRKEGEAATEAEIRQATRLQRLLAPFLGPIGLLDTSAFIAVNRLPHPIALNLAMRALSAVMSKGMAWAFGLVVASRLDPERGGRALRGVLPTMWLTGIAIEIPVKRIFNRSRPYTVLTLTTVHGSKPNGYSFPSAHAAVSFAAAWLLRPYYPKLAPAFFALASVVGFSRLYLGVHYLSDVLIGAASGTILASLIKRLLDALDRAD